MGRIETFKELSVWENAAETAIRVFVAFFDRSDLTVVRSIAANIRETWHKRRYPASFINKLSDAETKVAETQSRLVFAQRCRYLSEARSVSIE